MKKAGCSNNQYASQGLLLSLTDAAAWATACAAGTAILLLTKTMLYNTAMSLSAQVACA